MNLKTTLALLVLAGAGGILFWYSRDLSATLPFLPKPPETVTSDATATVLEEQLTPDKLQRIVVRQGDRTLTLDRNPNNKDQWNLPGNWPTRKHEVDELVHLLTHLRSRFAPLPLTGEEPLKEYGLDKPAVTVELRADGKDYRLSLGERTDAAVSPFARPTYLRLGERQEVLRLAPGLIAALDRPADYYQQRQLFPTERVAADPGSATKADRLAAQKVVVKESIKDGTDYTLTRQGDDWLLQAPVKDHVDPDRLKTILTAVPDLWAETFVSDQKKDLAEYGLKEPQETIAVTLPSGETRTLLVGKEAATRTRTETRPPPPGAPPGLAQPQREVVHETYRFAKLQDNAQVFEIKADKLKDLAVPLADLRDARVARFRTEDVTRVEVARKGQKPIVLAKKDGKWSVQEPIQVDAETAKITELLDKLSALQARDKDVLDKADPKSYELDDPAATITVTAEEEVNKDDPAARKKVTKTFTLLLGKHDGKANRSYVQRKGLERVNAVEDNLLPLALREPLAYRGRRIFDFIGGDLADVKVRRDGEDVELKQADGKWTLAQPVQAEADAGKVGQLTNTLGGLEAVEYVADHVPAEDLEKKYGLGKPALTATLTFLDKNKPAKTLLIGKQRDGKPEYFAKLADADSVFAVKKEIRDDLNRDSLAYRPLQLWQMAADDVAEVRVQKQGQDEYRLAHQDAGWKITAPFEAAPQPAQVEPLVQDVLAPRCERYQANAAKDLKEYGLDNPTLRLTVVPKKKDGDKDAKKEPAPRTLLVGKPTRPDAATRYAKLGDGDAVFVVGDRLVAAVDRDALDLLDRKLLSLDRDAVAKLAARGGDGKLALSRDGNAWQVVESPADKFPADAAAVDAVLKVWGDLQARKFAAYGPKVDAVRYGLDKPAASVTATLTRDGKDETHTLDLGKPVEGDAGDRYARLDNGPGVAVLAAADVRALTQSYLAYVSHSGLTFDVDAVKTLTRAGAEPLELARRDDGWFLVKPQEQRADDRTVRDLLDGLKGRVARVAAYPAKDLASFGLEKPEAVWSVRLPEAGDGGLTHTVKVGKAADDGGRFAQFDDGKAVVVLAAPLAQRLVAGPLGFRNLELARFVDADKAVLQRGPRRAVFAKVDGTWKLTEPVAADAEQTPLDNLVNAVTGLRAAELVTEKPEKLEPYGLDKPELRWQFFDGSDEKLSLLVGKEEKNGRRYAKLANGDLVFLLPPALTTQLLAEYRNRAVWSPSLDSAQAEELRLTRGGDSFTLEKKDGAWQVAGKPDLKVKEDVVNDTLAAVAGLRVERYVVDKGADLKLYGLQPPELTVEVGTPSGKRMLEIGRPEGESKRYYARVAGMTSGEVFLLSEADAGRIVRPVTAFTQPEAKPRKGDGM